jgi:hypothetical protein
MTQIKSGFQIRVIRGSFCGTIRNLDFIEKSAVRSVEANVVYATAIKRV